MRRQQQKKNYPGRIRSAGEQTTLKSFLFKSRAVDGDAKTSATPEAGEEEEAPACPPKREIVRVTTRAVVKEKASAFSSVGSSSGRTERGEAGGALGAAVFKGFHSSAPAARAEGTGAGDVEKAVEDGDGGGVRFDMEGTETGSSHEPWKKRKSPAIGDGHEEQGSSAKARHVVVLGDDPRPRPTRMPGRSRPTRGGSHGEDGRALYNHYASGGGWWHGDMEGVDGEEVGWTDDMWEGMGSVTLGGLEWH